AILAPAAVFAHVTDQGLLHGRPARHALGGGPAGRVAGEPAVPVRRVVTAQPGGVPRDGHAALPVPPRGTGGPHVAGARGGASRRGSAKARPSSPSCPRSCGTGSSSRTPRRYGPDDSRCPMSPWRTA